MQFRDVIRYAYAPCPGGDRCQMRLNNGPCHCPYPNLYRVFDAESGLRCPYHTECDHNRPFTLIRETVARMGTKCLFILFREVRPEDLHIFLAMPELGGTPAVLKTALQMQTFDQHALDYALDACVWACRLDSLQILLEAGANPNKNYDGAKIVDHAEALVEVYVDNVKYTLEARSECLRLLREAAKRSPP
jgi:hypothetical protein